MRRNLPLGGGRNIQHTISGDRAQASHPVPDTRLSRPDSPGSLLGSDSLHPLLQIHGRYDTYRAQKKSSLSVCVMYRRGLRRRG